MVTRARRLSVLVRGGLRQSQLPVGPFWQRNELRVRPDLPNIRQNVKI